jgi:RNA polymerase sigma-70 factor (ECF subfamily)
MLFREVYDEHVAFVWRSLRRLGVREAHLKDAMQDVFIIVHRKLPSFVERAHFTTWLFRICHGVARDYRRRAYMRREVPGDAVLEAAVTPGDEPIQALEHADDLALFEAALGTLDIDQRAVFMLFEIENMTGDAISAALQIPLGTVYSRLRLARQAFRRAVLRHAARRASGLRSGGAT